jgi:hypothetical protein
VPLRLLAGPAVAPGGPDQKAEGKIVRMRALARNGARLVGASGAFWIVAAVTGLPPGWRTGVFLFLFIGGVIDLAVAAEVIARSGGNPARELTRGWRGAGATGRRRPERERARVLSQTDAIWGNRIMMPPGHWEAQGSMAEWAESMARLSIAVARYRAPLPEKRLMTPTASVLREAGVELPEHGPRWSTRDRTGRPTPPFPLHYRTLPEEHYLADDGVRMTPGLIEAHTDADHPGCPVCETWRAENGL